MPSIIIKETMHSTKNCFRCYLCYSNVTSHAWSDYYYSNCLIALQSQNKFDPIRERTGMQVS